MLSLGVASIQWTVLVLSLLGGHSVPLFIGLYLVVPALDIPEEGYLPPA